VQHLSLDQRDQSTICVVEDPLAVITSSARGSTKACTRAARRARSRCTRHVEDLKIEELVRRVEGHTIAEVILATNPNVEGDTTPATSSVACALGVRVTRLARGLPVGVTSNMRRSYPGARLEGRRVAT